MQIPLPEFISDLKPYQLEYLQSAARFNALMWHRGAKKTTALLNKRIPQILQQRGLYWYVGPYLNQAIDTVWKDPNTNIFRWLPEELLKLLQVNKNDHSITFPNGSVWQLKGANYPNTLRGPKPTHIDVDEYGEIAKRWGSEFREAILEPSIQSSGGGIDYAGTPKGNNDFNYLLALARKDPANWWASIRTVEDTGVYTKEQIEEIRRNAVHLDFFEQEYYCRILEGASSVFKNVEKAVLGTLEAPQRGEEYLFGIDLARTFDSTVIVGFKLSTNHLVYFEKIHNQTWETQKQRIYEILWRYGRAGQPARAIVDATGMGDSFVEQLQLTMNPSGIPLNIDGLKIANNLIKRNLVEKLATYIENRYITFPDIPELKDELYSMEYKTTGSGNVQYSAPEGKHDDIPMAMALAISQMDTTPRRRETDTSYIPINSHTGYIQ